MMKKVDLKASLPKKKIDSPLAKYNNAGQLFCILCNSQVKNEMFWIGHVNGKSHREALVNLKANKRPALESAGSQPPAKKKAEDPFKKPAVENSLFKVPVPPEPPIPNTARPLDLGSRSSSDTNISNGSRVQQHEGDGNEKDGESMEIGDEEKSNTNAVTAGAPAPTQLPAGFFDDPKEDAKARGLEWRDPEEIEWEKFVKEIAGEEIKSSNLKTLDDEESTKSRELDEIEEQMTHWQRVIELEQKAEEVRKQKASESKPSKASDGPDEDDLDYDEELDWRSKQH